MVGVAAGAEEAVVRYKIEYYDPYQRNSDFMAEQKMLEAEAADGWDLISVAVVESETAAEIRYYFRHLGDE